MPPRLPDPAASSRRPTGTPEHIYASVRDLVGRLAACPDVRSVVVECTWGPTPSIRLLGVPEPIAGHLGLERIAGAPAFEPPEALWRESRFALVGPVPPLPSEGVDRVDERSRPGDEVALEPPPEPPVPLAAGGWSASQVHLCGSIDGRLWAALRLWTAAVPDGTEGILLDRLRPAVGPVQLTVLPFSRGRRREWTTAAWRHLRPDGRFALGPGDAARLALLGGVPAGRAWGRERSHTLVFGASGSGKSRYLVAAAREHVVRGAPAVLFDLHGDLAHRFVRALPADQRERVVAIDAGSGPGGPAIGFLDGSVGSPDAERAHLLAALRRVGADEGGAYWGFRLDRIFDTFARIVQEEGGGLGDLYDLLTDPARREGARLSVRAAPLGRFLEELPAVVRRNPEFLWPAAARLSRIVLAPRLASLVVPRGAALPVGALLAEGRPLVWRLPIGEIGPEAAEMLVTLLAARVYLGQVAQGAVPETERRSVLFVLDEAQAIAPPLLAEMLTEGRKFGIAVIAATQFPGRLEGPARAAASGSVGTHIFFRLPRPVAVEIAPWLGIAPRESIATLPTLPTGSGFEVRTGPGGRRRPLVVPPEPEGPAPDPWPPAVERTHREFGGNTDAFEPGLTAVEEQILLEVLAREETGRTTTPADLAERLGGRLPVDQILGAVPTLIARRELFTNADGLLLGPLARTHLGFLPGTGATRESAEHRALLLEAFRLFARHGLRIEILRQGRFDTRLPDALYRSLAPRDRSLAAPLLADRIAKARDSWAWRLSGGRDIFLEAEVSGADRPDRIRRGLAKARSAQAFALFLVADADRGRRIRRILTDHGRSEGTVWVLRRALSARAGPGAGEASSASFY